MNPYRYKLALRAWHPRLSADEVASILGLEGGVAKTVGEQRRTPTGRPLKGMNVSTYCSFPLAEGASSRLIQAIEKSNKRLRGRQTRRITHSGGQLEYFVGVFLRGNSGFELDVGLAQELARLRIKLSLDIYP